MPIKVIDGNLFDTTAGYICHQVNCQGRMGSGVAKTIREKYPEAFQKYLELFVKRGSPLGRAQFVQSNGKVIVNMFAQDRYGYNGARYTDYNAFMRCLAEIRRVVPIGATIAMPYKIGCGLGGGDWGTIYRMIEHELGTDYIVELWRKEG